MRQPLSLLLALSVFLMAACAPAGITQSGASGSCANQLYPVKPGATWTYESSGGPAGTLTYTDTISEVHEGGFTVTSEFWDMTRPQAWACQLDGLQALQIGSASAAGISTQGITAEFSASDVTGISLPRAITPGIQWQYSLKLQGTMAMPGEQQSPASGTYSLAMQEMGTESIIVPAGTFTATRIQANSTVDIMTDFQGIQVPVKYTGVTLLWYAPGVGFIKSVENGDFSGTTFSITTELQSYNIP